MLWWRIWLGELTQMRNRLISIIVVILLSIPVSSTPILSIQSSDISMMPEKELVPSQDTKTVLFENSHSPISDYSPDARLANFSDDLIAEGYDVQVMDTWDDDVLMSADILIISVPTIAYSADEKIAILDFVALGGSLFLPCDIPASTECDTIAALFQVVLTDYALYDLDDNTGTSSYIKWQSADNFGNHPISAGVSNMTTYLTYGFERYPIATTEILITDGNNNTLVGADSVGSIAGAIAFEYARGLGRVVMTGDITWLSTNDDDNDEITNYFQADNEILARNIVEWLSDVTIPETVICFDESHSPINYIGSMETIQYVIFDESHNPLQKIDMDDDGVYGYADDGSGYGDMASYLDVQYGISKMTSWNYAFLTGTHILVLARPTVTYSALEQEAIRSHVANGGGLLLVGEGGLTTATNDIARLFGACFYAGSIADNDEYDTYDYWVRLGPENINSHPTTLGVHEAWHILGGAFNETPSNAVVLMETDDDGTEGWHTTPPGSPSPSNVPLAIAFEYGYGRVVMMGDTNTFSHVSTGNFLNNGNDTRFMNNVINWLSNGGKKHDYYLAAQALRDAGYGVVSMIDFDADFLGRCDALVMVSDQATYSNSEIEDIVNYVQGDGHGLFMMPEWTTLGQDLLPIAEEFGIEFVSDNTYLDDANDFLDVAGEGRILLDEDNVGSHSIMTGIDEIWWAKGTGFTILPSTATILLSMDDDVTSQWDNGSAAAAMPMMVALESERGRVAVLGDSSPFCDFIINGSIYGDDETGMIDRGDNKQLLLNTIEWLVDNRPPVVEVISPNGGEALNGTVTISWSSDDYDGDNMTYSIAFSPNNGASWTNIVSNLEATTYGWDTRTGPNSEQCLIRITAQDSKGNVASDDSDGVFIVNNGFSLGNIPTEWLIIGAIALVIVIGVVCTLRRRGGSTSQPTRKKKK